MQMRSVLGSWGWSSKRDQTGSAERAVAFRERLVGELARASRLGEPTALIAFASEDRSSEERLVRLAEELGPRIRVTDEIGWLGPGELGVLLRFTSGCDAVALAEMICARFDAAGVPAPHCTVYAHPPPGMPLGDSTGRT